MSWKSFLSLTHSLSFSSSNPMQNVLYSRIPMCPKMPGTCNRGIIEFLCIFAGFEHFVLRYNIQNEGVYLRQNHTIKVWDSITIDILIYVPVCCVCVCVFFTDWQCGGYKEGLVSSPAVSLFHRRRRWCLIYHSWNYEFSYGYSVFTPLFLIILSTPL